ncbi:MAG: HAD hydrolase-like protein [Nitrospirae bacterium]|nr:HAD hydrolase-like protein [Magnetococcales bacterium]HAT51187.1 hypothetical protein [Alphaproteobacteria bacterium]
MSVLLSNWCDLAQFMGDHAIKVVGLDLRGTLIDPQRKDNLFKVARSVLTGVPPALLESICQTIPDLVIQRYEHEEKVCDWTLMTCLELIGELRTLGVETGNLDLESLYSLIVRDYFREARHLVDDDELAALIAACNEMNIAVHIVADGMAWRESAIFQQLFPASSKRIAGFFSSSMGGINKLSPRYYQAFADALSLPVSHVLIIGDRFDKDVRVALKAGCRALLIAPDPRAPLTAPSLNHILPAISRSFDTGVILGRFQPFHLEHLRYARAASHRARTLIVGITQPFGANSREPGRERTRQDHNPYPYWLREQCVRYALSEAGIRVQAILPLPLDVESLQSALAPGTPIFTTVFDRWGEEKEALLRQSGFTVYRLEVGGKTITGSQVRTLIGKRDNSWRTLVPPVVAEQFGEAIETYLIDGRR